MKRYIRASEVPTKDQYFAEVISEDRLVIEKLAAIRSNYLGPLIKIPSTRNDLGTMRSSRETASGESEQYSLDDKCIHLVETRDDCRVYSIPYVFYDGLYYELRHFELTIYDDSSFQFGRRKIRNFGEFADSTLFNDVRLAKLGG